jgi:hypothetical protein
MADEVGDSRQRVSDALVLERWRWTEWFYHHVHDNPQRLTQFRVFLNDGHPVNIAGHEIPDWPLDPTLRLDLLHIARQEELRLRIVAYQSEVVNLTLRYNAIAEE